MTAVITDLANVIVTKKLAGERFVLMLGAGASLSSGVKQTSVMQEEILARYGTRFESGKTEDRFDKLWGAASRDERDLYLKPYLSVEPGQGYRDLANLVKEGFFDLAISFNYDDLLERALKAVGFDDYRVIVRGEYVDEEIQKLVEAKEKRFKLVKLHGSVAGSKHFLFDLEEMYQYPAPIEAFVKGATSRNIIVCGYAFNDVCVERAFADQGGSIICVNPSGIPRNVRVKVKHRNSETWAIPMDFDSFCAELHERLLHPEPIDQQNLPNPFKFLESYEELDKDIIQGRGEETKSFLDTIQRNPLPQLIVIVGQPKAGKTSFTRACLMPALKAGKYETKYVRCQEDLVASVLRSLHESPTPPDGDTLPQALARLAAAGDRKVVVFLDQFDRVAGPLWQWGDNKKRLSDSLAANLWPGAAPNLTIVPIVADPTLGGWLVQEGTRAGLMSLLETCLALDPKQAAKIIAEIATRAGYEFEKEIFADLEKKYEQSAGPGGAKMSFTLAHIQAICHLLAVKKKVDHDSYLKVASDLEALNQAINVVDFISFVEDKEWADSVWARNIIKVPLKESKERIAEFVRKHYEDIRPTARGPR